MFTFFHLCLPLFTFVYPCLPLFTFVYLCLPLFNWFCACLIRRLLLVSFVSQSVKKKNLATSKQGRRLSFDILTALTNIRSTKVLQKRQHFYAKTTSAKLYIYIGVGSRDLFIDEGHTALGIFPVFFPCMLPTPLCGIFYFKLNQIAFG